jgi:hypothetical protein
VVVVADVGVVAVDAVPEAGAAIFLTPSGFPGLNFSRLGMLHGDSLTGSGPGGFDSDMLWLCLRFPQGYFWLTLVDIHGALLRILQ